MPITRTLLLLALILYGATTVQARAECAQAEAIVDQIYPDSTPDKNGGYDLSGQNIEVPDSSIGTPWGITCKVWPAHPELTLALVPLMSSSSNDGNSGDLDLLVLDSKSMKLRHRLRLHDYMNDDAIRIGSLSLDTAHYQLAPGTLAFGIRKKLEGSSGPYPFEEVDLSLYAIVDGNLHTVLDGMAVSKSNGDWDTHCAGRFSDRSLVLKMGKASTNGFANIDALGTEEDRASYVDNKQQCQDKRDKRSLLSVHLRYDGHKYVVPKDFAALQ